MTFIAPIVEGHGEQQAVARLLHRLAQRQSPGCRLRVNDPIRVKSGSFFNDEAYFGRYLSLAAEKARQAGGGHVLILLDCDDDCPAQLGPRLDAQARRVSPEVSTIVALASREYETWFMAAAESLRGIEGMSPSVTAPQKPEATRNAKGWLGKHMPHGYDPIAHQLAFTTAFDLDAARSVDSFNHLYRRIEAIVLVSQ